MKPKKKGPKGNDSSSALCDCKGKDRFTCTPNIVYICVPGGPKKNPFLTSIENGQQTSYTLCHNSAIRFNIECPQTQAGKMCCYEEEGGLSTGGLSESTLNCTFEMGNKAYTIVTSVCEIDDHPSTTVTNTETTDSTTVALTTFKVQSTLQKTTSYVTTFEQTKPISTKAPATSPTQPDSSVTGSTRRSPPSTRLVTDTTVKTTEKMDTPAPSNRRGNSLPVAVTVPLTLIFLLVALVLFVRWKKGGRRCCKNYRRKLNRSQKSTLNPDSSASAVIVNPTYDLDGSPADNGVHLASFASVQEEEGNYADISPREYESYRPNQHPDTYTALQKVRSPGTDDNEDDDLPVYTPIPVNNKPAIKNAEANSDYVEPNTVLHYPGDGAGGASAPEPDGKRRGSHQDFRSPNPKSSGYVDVDAPPIVFAETPAVSKTSFKEPQDQESTDNPKEVYYFKLRGLSDDTSGELDGERLNPSGADGGQYQSLEASPANLPLDTKMADAGDEYNMISRNANNLAKTAANASSGIYNHLVIQTSAHSNGADNAYDTVDRPRLEAALKC